MAWARDHLGRGDIDFEHLDVHNDRYNPTGTMQVDEVDLGTDRFDRIVLASVFTHMWPQDIAHYLHVCAAALRPGGSIFATFFLLDDTWDRLAERDLPREFDVPHVIDEHTRVQDLDNPLHVIAVRLPWLEQAASEAGLHIARPPEFGRWSGRNGRTMLQDCVVFEHERPRGRRRRLR